MISAPAQMSQAVTRVIPGRFWPGKEGITMATGTVKWFNGEKGFGFITRDDGGPDAFVHFSAMSGSGYGNLEEGQKIQYEASQGRKGLQAANVQRM
jgi:CspA family cold shock protein